jgi:cytochrome c oxidase cbb3-type subunit 2
MPAFPWLFEVVGHPPTDARIVTLPPAFAPSQGKAVATQRALDLVAYLISLRQTSLTGVGSSPIPSGTSDGARQYAANCAACNQATGDGVTATFPPLKGDVGVNDSDPTRHIATVLYGLQGKRIGQILYPVTMPPFGSTLSDEQVAAIVNFERSSWGNHGPPITPAQVRQVRSAGVQP